MFVDPGAVVATGKFEVDSDHEDLTGIKVGMILNLCIEYLNSAGMLTICGMKHLRECVWRDLLKLPSAPLPPVCQRFRDSRTWASQTHVLDLDLSRMPYLHKDNVRKIVMRHAATMPNHGYCQGNLYLIYVLGTVFSDEASIYWAYSRMCQRTHCFGPSTYSAKTVPLPPWIMSRARRVSDIPDETWDLLLRLRWLFIMFGQTFVSHKCLCAVWDYCVHARNRMLCVCAALLEHPVAASTCACPLEVANQLVSVQITDISDTAAIIASAQNIESTYYS